MCFTHVVTRPHPPGLPSLSLARLTAPRLRPPGAHGSLSQEAGSCVPSERTRTVATSPLVSRDGGPRPTLYRALCQCRGGAGPASLWCVLLSVPAHSAGCKLQARVGVQPGLRLPLATAAWPGLRTLGTAAPAAIPVASFPLVRLCRSSSEEARPDTARERGAEGGLGSLSVCSHGVSSRSDRFHAALSPSACFCSLRARPLPPGTPPSLPTVVCARAAWLLGAQQAWRSGHVGPGRGPGPRTGPRDPLHGLHPPPPRRHQGPGPAGTVSCLPEVGRG